MQAASAVQSRHTSNYVSPFDQRRVITNPLSECCMSIDEVNRIVPPVNPKRSEKMGLAHSPSAPCPSARHANRAGICSIVSLQNPSGSPVGKPCPPASTQRSASCGEEAEVDATRPALLGLAVQRVG